jgi:uncharacterized protein YijF (DUF1287 family)
MSGRGRWRACLLGAAVLSGCLAVRPADPQPLELRSTEDAGLARLVLSTLPADSTFRARLVRAALERTFHVVHYDPAYVQLTYPMGDVPETTGVCTDEVIRAYRALGVDLQRLVHEDMERHFAAYPKKWRLRGPDANIDHRRVPNLQTFLKRRNASLRLTARAEDYRPGDLITCTVPPDLPHIAIVVPPPDSGAAPWIVHNIGAGPRYEDRLFEFPLTGHYRWHPVDR